MWINASAELPPRGKVNKRYRRKFRQEANVKKSNGGNPAERKTLMNVSAEAPPESQGRVYPFRLRPATCFFSSRYLTVLSH
ncbi:hypothetical protein [Hoylesella saccharolytica]|uniref:hypothetical protein n=1 Tax=Hoylesella saccharolytica TaxID=633701 RepID=UPI0028E57D3B|nr:hypothetical protein [Hoylesella saccharolytica]